MKNNTVALKKLVALQLGVSTKDLWTKYVKDAWTHQHRYLIGARLDSGINLWERQDEIRQVLPTFEASNCGLGSVRA